MTLDDFVILTTGMLSCEECRLPELIRELEGQWSKAYDFRHPGQPLKRSVGAATGEGQRLGLFDWVNRLRQAPLSPGPRCGDVRGKPAALPPGDHPGQDDDLAEYLEALRRAEAFATRVGSAFFEAFKLARFVLETTGGCAGSSWRR